MFVSALLAMIIAGAAITLDRHDVAIVEPIDRVFGDKRIAWLSPTSPAQRSDIALVLIAEETLLDYDARSPVDRGLLADVIRVVDAAAPRAIGIDFIFDRRTANDPVLIAAIQDAKSPIVLGAVDERIPGLLPASLRIQSELLAAMGRPVGHMLLERRAGYFAANDNAVRLVAADLQGAPPRPSLSAVLARTVGATHEPANRTIAWLRPPGNGTPLFAAITIPQHLPQSRKPALEGIFRDSWRSLIKGRIVIIGGSMVDRDQHATPLSSLTGVPVAGVEIHAQALAQRLDGNRDVVAVPTWILLPTLTLLAWTFFWVARFNWVGSVGWVQRALVLLAPGVLSLAAFGLFRVDLPSTAIAIAWIGGVLAGRLSGGGEKRQVKEVAT